MRSLQRGEPINAGSSEYFCLTLFYCRTEFTTTQSLNRLNRIPAISSQVSGKQMVEATGM
jgi:hypothetical protein